MLKDFTPMRETISLHGLGFIQVVLGGDQRLHVWHPGLPRRACYQHSAVHNHRFAFTSTVLVGTQVNQRCDLEIVREGEGSHQIISHNGPRNEKGSRSSYPVADCNLFEREIVSYPPGESYSMGMYEYHRTLASSVVVTLLRKEKLGDIHSNSVCRRGVTFDYEFDRFQLSPAILFGFVAEALGGNHV